MCDGLEFPAYHGIGTERLGEIWAQPVPELYKGRVMLAVRLSADDSGPALYGHGVQFLMPAAAAVKLACELLTLAAATVREESF